MSIMSRKITFLYKGNIVDASQFRFATPQIGLQDLQKDILYYILGFCDLLALCMYNKTSKMMHSMLQEKSRDSSTFWSQKILKDKVACYENTFYGYMQGFISNYKITKMFHIMEKEFHIEMTEGEICSGGFCGVNSVKLLNTSKLEPRNRTGRISYELEVIYNEKYNEMTEKISTIIPTTLTHFKKPLKTDIRGKISTIDTKYRVCITIDVDPSYFGLSIYLIHDYDYYHGESGPPMISIFNIRNVSQKDIATFATALTYHFPQVEWKGRYSGISSISFNERNLRKNMNKVRYTNKAPFYKRLELLEEYRLENQK